MKRDRSKAQLDAILREVREDLVPPGRGPDGDFSAVDAKLFARITKEQATPERDRIPVLPARTLARSRYFWGGTALVAAAAAAIFVIRHPAPAVPGEGPLAEATQSGAADRNHPSSPSSELGAESAAAAFQTREGRGDIRIAGKVAEPGHVLGASESVETTDARATFVSGQEARPAVTWLLEERSHVDVRHVQMPLTLALSQGAVEAQVAPVPQGEAFAVDIDGVRVAVHGTHLRVSREGRHVTVDLTEGVVAIGAVPQSSLAGLTEGTTVTAPAHVEFDTANLLASFRIDRAPASVRAAVPLAQARTEGTRPAARDARDVQGAAQPEKPASARTANGNPAAAPSQRSEEIIAKGVRACVANQLREATVHVTVSSKLSLKIGDDGMVRMAQFNPPLAPEAQECASRIIYKTRFPRGGDIEIPLSSE
ncbi:FecR domain-containing protein [Pendulispora albinea]|uniref:FecR family protein n=1 Tax=Pendulispora albinea TaxID=2741071 RepID=A0ABZ2LZ87_9BACT